MIGIITCIGSLCFVDMSHVNKNYLYMYFLRYINSNISKSNFLEKNLSFLNKYVHFVHILPFVIKNNKSAYFSVNQSF